MAKKITRQVTTYEYRFGTYNLETGVVENLVIRRMSSKLGPRLLEEYIKENNLGVCVSITEETRNYSMDLDRFIEMADEDKEDENND